MPIALLGDKTPAALSSVLRRHGYQILHLPRNDRLPAPVAAHPDLSVFFAEDAVLTTADYAKAAKDELAEVCRAVGRPLQITESDVGDRYPQDVLLDALPLGGRLFCLPEATATELTDDPAYRVVPVRQGYAKCAALPIGENALASADPSILAAAEREGIETLSLPAGGIALRDYGCGFIGGATSFSPYAERGETFFCGDLRLYAGGERLVDFLGQHRISCHGVPGLPPTDVGTIFLL